MTHISEFFAGQFFRTEELDRAGQEFTIENVRVDKIGTDDKLVLVFLETEKILPLNKTNALTLAEVFGDETDDWTGERVCVFRDTTLFNGRRIPCIRLRVPRSGGGSGSGSGGGSGGGSGSGSGGGGGGGGGGIV